jgi:hypothetical protein
MSRKSMASPRRTSRGDALLTGASDLISGLMPIFGAVRQRVLAHPRWSAAAAVLLASGLVLGLVPESDSSPAEATRTTALALPGQNLSAKPEPSSGLDTSGLDLLAEAGSMSELQAPDPDPGTAELDWTLVEVRPGQTMDRIFRDLDLGPGLLHRVVHLDQNTRSLTRIRPGDQFAFDIDPDDGFRAMRAEFDEEHWLFIENHGDDLTSRIEPRWLDRRIVEASGTISSSLFNAAKAAGLSDNMTMRLANIFGWDVDFALDIRAGDRFSLVYEEIWRDGEFLRDGPILAARFVNRGDSFEAIRFDTGDGPDYFCARRPPHAQGVLACTIEFHARHVELQPPSLSPDYPPGPATQRHRLRRTHRHPGVGSR